MSDVSRVESPLSIEVYVNKDERIVHVDFTQGDKATRLEIPSDAALQLGRALRDAVHKMGKAKVR